MINKDKFFSNKGFPNHLAPDEEKNKESFGLQFAKQIEYEWFYRPEVGHCAYYDKRDKYHKLRLYARGEQDVSIYKKLLNKDGDTTYSNYDFRPLQIVPKFMNLLVNQMSERLFDVKAEATDRYSTDLKENHRKQLRDYVLSKPAIDLVKKHIGVDLEPPNSDEYPTTTEEVELFMKLKYKPAIEIATEEALKYTLDLNDYDEIQSSVIYDIASIGLGAVKHTTDNTRGITIEYVDPADVVYSYPTHKNFKDVHYYGEVKRITIMELKRLSGNKFSNDELKDLVKSTSEWTSYHGTGINQQHYREDDIENVMVDVMFFTFKSLNNLSYKKKYLKNGGYKMTKKESTFDKVNKEYTGYDAVKKVIDVWYEGVLILGTNKIFNYKLCENMIRPEGYLNITLPSYVFYAPELYQNRTRSLVERIIPYVDQMQQIHIKLQQLIAKARPNGVYIDVSGLNEIPLGDGNTLDPLEVMKIYDETGNVLGTSLTQEGDYNYGRQPISELKNGIIDGLDRLIGAYNHYLNLLRDAIGIPQGADASMPHPDTLVGVQQQVALNSNTATRHILDGALDILSRLSKGLALRMKDIFEYSDLKEVYINAIGKINVKLLESIKKYHLHDLGINIDLKPDIQERQYLEANIGQALAKDLITLDDAIDIRNINNIKLANELLKTRRVHRQKERVKQEQQMEMLRAQTQERSVMASAQAESQKLQIKSQSEMGLIEAKTMARLKELEKEAEIKAKLMEQEFSYNMQLRGMEVQNSIGKEKYKEDRKDKRLDRNNTQASQLIEQRAYNQPAKTFESQEDNVSGSIEVNEIM